MDKEEQILNNLVYWPVSNPQSPNKGLPANSVQLFFVSSSVIEFLCDCSDHTYCGWFCSATSTTNLPPDSFFLLCRSDWSRLRHFFLHLCILIIYCVNLITYASSLFSFIKKNYLFHSNTGTVSWEIPTPLNLVISLFQGCFNFVFWPD